MSYVPGIDNQIISQLIEAIKRKMEQTPRPGEIVDATQLEISSYNPTQKIKPSDLYKQNQHDDYHYFMNQDNSEKGFLHTFVFEDRCAIKAH
jgi:hypothetical protein